MHFFICHVEAKGLNVRSRPLTKASAAVLCCFGCLSFLFHFIFETMLQKRKTGRNEKDPSGLNRTSYFSFFCLGFTYSARIAFKMAITATPTSANTASHIFAKPSAPNNRMAAFTAKANTMFS